MRRFQTRAGFTIMELMTTVVIIGILAMIAVPTFSGYIYKSRVSEATTFLATIKARQESYRAEFGRYCAVNGDDWGTYNPTSIPGTNAVTWTSTTEWEQLGARPEGLVRFQYATVAGDPGDTAPSGSNLDESDFWFAARARGDLDGDSTTFFVEIYSQANSIYNSATNSGGWE